VDVVTVPAPDAHLSFHLAAPEDTKVLVTGEDPPSPSTIPASSIDVFVKPSVSPSGRSSDPPVESTSTYIDGLLFVPADHDASGIEFNFTKFVKSIKSIECVNFSEFVDNFADDSPEGVGCEDAAERGGMA
jgi:hypothetical protein